MIAFRLAYRSRYVAERLVPPGLPKINATRKTRVSLRARPRSSQLFSHCPSLFSTKIQPISILFCEDHGSIIHGLPVAFSSKLSVRDDLSPAALQQPGKDKHGGQAAYPERSPFETAFEKIPSASPFPRQDRISRSFATACPRMDPAGEGSPNFRPTCEKSTPAISSTSAFLSWRIPPIASTMPKKRSSAKRLRRSRMNRWMLPHRIGTIGATSSR